MTTSSCGFPDGPTCVSLGVGENGLEQFPDDGCCLLPFRCGNVAGELCERVAVNGNNGGSNNGNNNNGNNNGGNNNGGNVDDEEEEDVDAGVDDECGFPNGPDCESLGEGANGLEQFIDDGCCLLPFRCGNIAGERCERVSA